MFQTVGRSSDLNRAVVGLSVCESCPSCTNEFEEFGLPLVTAGSVGSAVCRDVLCRTGVLLCSACFSIVALSLPMALGVSTAELSAFRTPFQRQPSEALKHLLRICEPFGAHIGWSPACMKESSGESRSGL